MVHYYFAIQTLLSTWQKSQTIYAIFHLISFISIILVKLFFNFFRKNGFGRIYNFFASFQFLFSSKKKYCHCQSIAICLDPSIFLIKMTALNKNESPNTASISN